MIDKKIWDDVIYYLLNKEIISDYSFNLWFKDISIEFKDNTIIITFPNVLSKEKFDTSFADIIKKTFSDFNGVEIIFETRVSSKIKKLASQEKSKDENKEFSESSSLSEIFKFNQIKFLNPRYTFDNFVIGKNNQFCAAAAKRVAKFPGQAFNPLFIYGGIGLGKTHILQAIAHLIIQSNSYQNIVYMPVDQFVNEFIYAIKNDQMSSFRLKYRNSDVLLLDDIQFLERKDASMEEFFHTFNVLHQAQKQMVFTCDKPPSELKDFEERVRNRMEWGLTVSITPPDFETRVAILKKKAELEKRDVSEQAIMFIAKNVKTSIRELESAIIKIFAYCDIFNLDTSTIQTETVKEILKDQLKYMEEKKIIQIDDIIRKVAETFKISTIDMKSQKRNKSISLARNIAMFLARELTSTSTTEIGLSFGGKDHTTIIHAYKKIQDLMESDDLLKSAILSIKSELII